jgi:hypothetical protein
MDRMKAESGNQMAKKAKPERGNWFSRFRENTNSSPIADLYFIAHLLTLAFFLFYSVSSPRVRSSPSAR